MEAMREKWTDGRLDDMNARMAEGFQRVDADLRTLRSDMNTEFAAVRGEMKAEFAAVRGEMGARFEATQRLIVQVGGGLFGTMVIGFLAIVLTQH